ncbi:MAG: type II toxin-antitoxin system RelB/DinJ family antitoxin [Candidatus Competibacteraceae bacterium]
MRANAIIRTRIDANTKAQAAAVLAAMDLNLSDAVRLLMRRIVAEQRLPFDLVPNKATLKAMQELEQGKGKPFDSTEALFKDLGL